MWNIKITIKGRSFLYHGVVKVSGKATFKLFFSFSVLDQSLIWRPHGFRLGLRILLSPFYYDVSLFRRNMSPRGMTQPKSVWQ